MSLVPFDDRDGVIWLDGGLVPWREAKLHVLSHALHYASAMFEGERAYGGRVFKLSEHSERLIGSARILDMTLPYSAAEIDAATEEVLAANEIGDGYVRPIAWRGSEQMGVAAQNATIHVSIATWEWGAYFGDEALRGIRLATASYRRPSPETAPVKSKAAGLYMICTLARHKVQAAGYTDALMLDWRGRVAEATGANIFMVFDGALHTPTPDCFLDGITRRTVISLAREAGIEVVERQIRPEDLAKAQEAFLTGTAVELTPICEIDAHHFEVGPVTHRLVEGFERLVHAVGDSAASAA